MVNQEELGMIPTKPGVYLMKDQTGNTIYVGKAVSLRHRVRSYFQASAKHSPRIASMVRQVAKVEFITTSSEVEALALECNLIKANRPKYNVRLRDDKQYPWLKVTWQEPYPRIFVVRRPQKDGARYFGPYTNTGSMREIFRLLRQVFPIRTCKKQISPPGEENARSREVRPCLNYHIGRCLGPCSGVVDPVEYRRNVQDFCSVLEGNPEELVASLTEKMKIAAANLEYEKAAAFRDKLRALQRVVERQVVVSTEVKDRDVFGLAKAEEGVMVLVLQIRRGKLVARDSYYYPGEDLEEQEDFFRAFLLQYYDDREYIPKEILIPIPLADQEVITAWFREKMQRAVYVIHPQRGEKRRLLKMAMDNAATVLSQEMLRRAEKDVSAAKSLDSLAQTLALEERPKRIEAFDISNFQGAEPVASMVVFVNGLPQNTLYRRFKIKGVTGINDFAMMQEAVRRRFTRGLKEKAGDMEEKGFASFPDLLVIDGGKGQLSAVVEVLTDLGLEKQPVIGLAEEEEEIFLPGRPAPIVLPRTDEGLKLLQRVRDEAHRFAITFHRSLRDKKTTYSTLDGIKGIGPKRKRALLQRFGSVKRIKEATLEELLTVEGMTEKAALAVLQELKEL
jgi:excinuclease ABC subunit C